MTNARMGNENGLTNNQNRVEKNFPSTIYGLKNVEKRQMLAMGMVFLCPSKKKAKNVGERKQY